jgi:hypothetical protein
MATLEDLLVHAADLQRHKAHLLHQVQEMDDRLACVHIRIAEAQNLNHNSRAINLPTEILSSIFQAGLLPLPAMRVWKQRAKETRFEISVSHVSRLWRLIALSTPQLWTEIYMNLCVSPVELLDLYLKRSGTLLLNIMLDHNIHWDYLDYNQYNLHGYNFTQHLSSLVPHAARWRQFTIHAYLDRYSGTMSPRIILLPLVNLHVPALEKITFGCPGRSIKHEYRGNSSANTSINLFSGGAPALSSVALYDNYIHAVRPPLVAVTSLTLRNNIVVMPRELVGALLNPMPQFLTYLNLEGDMIWRFPSLPKIVELPSVRTLHLSFGFLGHHSGPHHLDFYFPFVEALTLEGYGVYDFPSYFHPSYPMPRSLTVMVTHGSDLDKAAKFIAAFPTIEEVVLNPKCTDIPFILNRKESTKEPLWPELRTMTIVDPDGADFMGSINGIRACFLSSIIDFVLARIASGRPVFDIKLSATLFPHIHHTHLKKLREGTSLEVLDD